MRRAKYPREAQVAEATPYGAVWLVEILETETVPGVFGDPLVRVAGLPSIWEFLRLADLKPLTPTARAMLAIARAGK